jgi:drug/metabolite transporter (DMT)-like permease
MAVLARKQLLAIAPSRAIRLIVVGGAGQALITYLSLRALDYLPVGILGFLFYTYPAWVAITSAAIGHERLTARRVIALVIAMCGIAVMVGAPAQGSLNTTGVEIALGTAFLNALYLPALHSIKSGIRAEVATLYLLIGVMLSFVVTSLLTGEARLPASFDQLKYVVILALLCTVLAFSTLIAGLRTLAPVRTSIISTVEPFFTTLLGVFLLSQPLERSTLIGGVLVACAVVMLQLTGAAKESEPARI